MVDSDSIQTADYSSMIKGPTEAGVSGKGTFDQLGNNINAIIGYSDVLITGDSSMQESGCKPMGTKSFLKTAASCTDSNGDSQTRYMYMDTVPSGNLLMSSGGLSGATSNFRGLVPGILESVMKLNPTTVMSSITNTDDSCTNVNLVTVTEQSNSDGNTSCITGEESHYILNDDIENINSCNFVDKSNPITGVKCTESFENRKKKYKYRQKKIEKSNKKQIPDNLIIQIYFASLTLFAVYIGFKACNKLSKR